MGFRDAFISAAVSPSRTFLVSVSSFVAGIAVHSLDEKFWAGGLPFAAAGAGSLAAAAVFRRQPPRRLAAVCAGLFLLGFGRFEAALAPPAGDPAGDPAAFSEERTFRGVVREEPRRGVSGVIVVAEGVSLLRGGAAEPLGGAIRLMTRAEPLVGYGDEIEWRCRPEPAPPAGGPVGDYFFLRKIDWSCAVRGPPKVIGRGGGSPLKRFLYASRAGLRRAAGNLLPEPESSLLLGLLIGDRDGLPPELKRAFRETGTAHVLAVSGYNVTKLVDLALLVFACAFARRRRAITAAALAVFCFVVFTGGDASVVRAGIMGGVSLLSALLGRRYGGGGSLMAAAALMLLFNPFSLRHDLGFQLSFAAVWGLHALAPHFTGALSFVPEIAGVRKILGETLAATLATLPLSLKAFGFLPLAGPAANVAILPFVPLAMGLGAAALAAGAVMPAAGMLAAFPAAAVLRFIEGAAAFFSLASPLSLSVRIGAAGAAVLYGWILLLWWALKKAEIKKREKNLYGFKTPMA